MAYVFPGITVYAPEGLDDEQRSRIATGWHVRKIAGMLSSLPGMVAEARAGRIPEGTPAEVVGLVAGLRAGLAAQLAMIDAATADVVAGCGLDGPGVNAKSNAKTKGK